MMRLSKSVESAFSKLYLRMPPKNAKINTKIWMKSLILVVIGGLILNTTHPVKKLAAEFYIPSLSYRQSAAERNLVQAISRA